jgi:hypothetical protein
MKHSPYPKPYHLPPDVPAIDVAVALGEQDAKRWANGEVTFVNVREGSFGWCWRHLTRDHRVLISWIAEWPSPLAVAE